MSVCTALFSSWPNELECLFVAGLSGVGEVRNYPRVEHLKDASLGPTCKHWTRLEIPARSKHFSSLGLFLGYEENKLLCCGLFRSW
jgi:hypothetical protein